MKKLLLLTLSLVLTMQLCACTINDIDTTKEEINNKIIVAVGIVPEATFVKKVTGNLVEIVTLIPPGNSPANYQPTTNEMKALSDAKIYFTLQMPTEEANILPKVSDFSKAIKIFNLRDAVSEIYPMRTFESHNHHEEDNNTKDVKDEENEESIDPHLWLSPKRSIIMVQAIADQLSIIDENNRQTYQKNAKLYIEEIKALDSNIQKKVSTLSKKAFMIYHGAYGYFADDYGFDMISIESEGKAATAAEMLEVIEHAKENGITNIFYQGEFDDNQAQIIANEIGGNVVKTTPLTPDYIQGLKDFTNLLVEQGDK